MKRILLALASSTALAKESKPLANPGREGSSTLKLWHICRVLSTTPEQASDAVGEAATVKLIT